MKRNRDISIRDALKKPIGQLCWGVEWTRQLNLSMSFGSPILEVVREPYKTESKHPLLRQQANCRQVTVRGRWWFWVYLAYWRIERSGKCLATYSSSLRAKSKAFLNLKGQKLVGIRVDPDCGTTRFDFDLDTVLEIRRMESDSKDDLWLLYEPDGYVLSVRGDGTLEHGPGSGLDERVKVKSRFKSALILP